MPSFRGEAKISTWIYRVALNTAIASLRKKEPDITYHSNVPDLAEEHKDDETAIRNERLFEAMKRLDDGEKAILALYLEELSYNQIAEIIGINENYVGVKLNRIKNKIEKMLIK
jgi:RNA polymerase sigma-70 factor (ECF subfamily)